MKSPLPRSGRTARSAGRMSRPAGHTHHAADRLRVSRLPIMHTATVCATLIAMSPLIPVYGSVWLWALGGLPAAALGCLAAALGSPGRRCWMQPLSLAIAQGAIGPWVAFMLSANAAGGPLDLQTAVDVVRNGWMTTLGSFKLLVALAPPVGNMDGALMAIWTMALFTSYLAAVLDASTRNPAGGWALLPLCAGFAGAALLGTGTGWHPIDAGLAFTSLMLVWLGWHGGWLEPARWRSAGAMASGTMAVSIVVALAAGSMIGPGRVTLRDHYNPPLYMADRVSPLSGMRAIVKRHRDDPVLTVTGLPAGAPVRLAVMDAFDGDVWNLSGDDSGRSSGEFRRSGMRVDAGGGTGGAMGDVTGGGQAGTPFRATFTIRGDWDDHWLPLAGNVRTVEFDDPRNAGMFHANAVTGTGLLTGDLTDGLRYVESGMLPRAAAGDARIGANADARDDRTGSSDGTGSEDVLVIAGDRIDMRALAEADAGTVDLPKPVDVPDSVRTFASATAGGEAHAGAKAIALARSLQRMGWFSRGLGDDYPSPPGHGNHRVDMLLGGGIMVGDSEQYASAMALMARELGIPSRVVYGLLPKDDDGRPSAARTERTPDGSASVTFTGLDIAAWTEVNLKGFGWVAFHPTPSETKHPDQSQRTAASEPQTLVRQPPVPLAEPLRDRTTVAGRTAITGDDAEPPDDGDTRWQAVRRTIMLVLVYGSPLWLLIMAIGMILAVKALALSLARRRGSPARRIARGWHAIRLLAYRCGVREAGSDAGGAPETARVIARKLTASNPTRKARGQGLEREAQGQDLEPALLDLARDADRAAFSGETVTEGQARRFWRSADRARRMMLRSLPLPRRWLARLSPSRPVSRGAASHSAASSPPTSRLPHLPALVPPTSLTTRKTRRAAVRRKGGRTT